MNTVIVDPKVKDFIFSLDKNTKAKIYKVIRFLRENGYHLSMPHSKKVGDRLYELRTQGEIRVRIFYTFYDDKWILLHGFVKKTMSIPFRELYIAKQRLLAID